jgi:hypothetical protein
MSSTNSAKAPQVLNLQRAVQQSGSDRNSAKSSRHTINLSGELAHTRHLASAEQLAGSFAEASNWIMCEKASGGGGVAGDHETLAAGDTEDLSEEELEPVRAAVNEDTCDHTTRRLKTFATTTLHNERSYLRNIRKVLDFKRHLEEHFNGSQTDLIVLFTGMSDIYKTHDIVASKLEDYLTSINELLTSSAAGDRSTSQAMRETFLANALQLLANIMEISFPVYYEFLRNYSKAMTILDKLERQAPTVVNCKSPQGGVKQLKSFLECKADFFGRNSDRTMVQPQVESSSSEF